MAEMEKIVGMLLEFEAGIGEDVKGLGVAEMFEVARRSGWSDDASDPGGATMCGVTLGCFRDFRQKLGLADPGKDELRRIRVDEWLEILRRGYWDRWRADEIEDQGVANMLVDWLWCSGEHGIKWPQRLVGVEADGIVGPATVGAVNRRSGEELLGELGAERRRYLEGIMRRNPRLGRFRRGWMRRVAAFEGWKA